MSDETELLKTQVDLTGLMEVLGKNLYSTPTVAIRELVQNAHDSCMRREMESKEPFEPSIMVAGYPEKSLMIIEDTGAGLTKEEIARYLATVGSGYTRRLRGGRNNEGLIGLFGLGFLTAFIVSKRVDVFTTSYKDPEQGWHFRSRSGESYTIEEAPARTVGTRVELHLSEDFSELSDHLATTRLLEHYCGLLPIPVFVGEDRLNRINTVPPPWRMQETTSPLRLKKLRLDFAKRFETFFDPICTFPLEPLVGEEDSPGEGLLWVQDGSSFSTSDNRNMSVFVRGMLVSRDERDLVPTWAGFVGGIVESKELKPTASREDLQKDDTYAQVADQIHETLITGLSQVAATEPEIWRRVLLRHNEALLGAALCDERLFDILSQDLKVPTSQGDLTIPTILKRSQNKIYVSIGEKGSYEETLFRALMVPIVTGTRYAALPFALRYGEQFQVQVVQLGTEEGNRSLFELEEIDPTQRERLHALLGEEGQEVVPARFKPQHLPLILMPDREAELKQRIESDEADRRIGSAVLGLARLYTDTLQDETRSRLYVNMSSEVIEQLLQTKESKQKHAASLLKSLSNLMVNHNGTSGGDFSDMLRRFSESLVALLEGPD